MIRNDLGLIRYPLIPTLSTHTLGKKNKNTNSGDNMEKCCGSEKSEEKLHGFVNKLTCAPVSKHNGTYDFCSFRLVVSKCVKSRTLSNGLF